MNLQIAMQKEMRPYFGPELRPHYLLTQFGLKGSAVSGFIGPCEVKTDSMVDWEDRMASDFIRSKLMLHYLGEFFGISLREGVLLQRLFMSIAGQTIAQEIGKPVHRDGDDLFIDGKKLSVSIVTASPVSRLLHVGINIDSTGAPVAAIGLQDCKQYDASQGEAAQQSKVQALGLKILQAFQAEVEGIEWACAKVRPVI